MKKLVLLSLLSGLLIVTQSSFGFDPGTQTVNMNEAITDKDQINARLDQLDFNQQITFNIDDLIQHNIDPENVDVAVLNDLLSDAIQERNLFAAAVLVSLGADINLIANDGYRQLVQNTRRDLMSIEN